MDMKDAAIRQADERATREGRRMWVYVRSHDQWGRGPTWFVRSYDEGIPYGAVTVYSTPPTKEEL